MRNIRAAILGRKSFPRQLPGEHAMLSLVEDSCARRARLRLLPRVLILIAGSFGFIAATPYAVAETGAAFASPETELQDLFVAVEQAHILGDSKAFADATPRSAPSAILAEFHAQQPATPAALQAFVEAHFDVPADISVPAAAGTAQPIVEHIDSLWDALTRQTGNVPAFSSLLSLPQPYVVPGGRFRELYYWDSYFTMLGLVQSGRRDLVEDMVNDFAYLIDTYGHVPNGTRTYYLSRSQPPFFFEMAGLLSPQDPVQAYTRYLPQLKREYSFWMQGADSLKPGTAGRRVVALAPGVLLNRYWDDKDTPRDESYAQDTELAQSVQRNPQQLYRDLRAAAESGWDFGSRWLADGHTLATINTTEIVPVDLNSLLYGLESAIASACLRQHDKPCARDFHKRASMRRAAMNRYLWDGASGTYLDYNWRSSTRASRMSAAALYPLFFGATSSGQARRVAAATRHYLLAAGGLSTTTLRTGQQWDLPNGWAPLQWIAVAGLRNYGERALARTIACRWMVTVNTVYNQSGKLVEKYDVTTSVRGGGGGEYALQDGFGWTNGVMRQLITLYPAEAAFSTANQCRSGS
jgi:alpha,alpha-trehalase